ncbi:PAS domain-containing protein [Streptosporangium becharense]|uniref:PAS domain-containing protein n=1 Tax=Streptosporangium becharense TaxID=1816182 RepID=A0A7W9IHN3_9ACTN|nr:PP2C family protein-serine/threonine phosphatase [Streptosporangium becharense]MBB2914675.1 PAS domain-containing protein [Streptosporangium becharense]MBB5820924.1 PAS domain-containing protein [Streptosporangium becharense]
MRELLDAIPGPACWTVPIRDETGSIIDFAVRAVNAEAVDVHGRRGGELMGVQSLGHYPSLRGTALSEAWLRVMETGEPEHVERFEYVETADGVPHRSTYTVRITRLAGGLVNTWTRHDEELRLFTRLERTERLGNLGWGHWNLATGEIVWSPQLYAIHERDPADGPLTLEEYYALVDPEDLPAVERAMAGLAGSGEPQEFEARVRIGDGTRHIRVSAQAVRDATGRLLEIHGIMHDVTLWRRAADELAGVNRRLQEENRLSVRLQNIIMPVEDGPRDLPGLRVATRYAPAETEAFLGGDWYQAIELDDGDVLLAVGDVAGHGLAAASAMAKLRHAITGLAFARHDPGRILTALNRLLCKLRPDVLATALVARYSPAERLLRWTHAGHPPMLLARGAHVERLLHPGVLLGVFPDASYTYATLRLRPDDVLVMFTDGLIEKRGRDLYEGLDLLSGTLARVLSSAAPEDRLRAVMDAMLPGSETDDSCVLVTQVVPSDPWGGGQ